MERYLNRGGDSPITAYEIFDGGIVVQFKGLHHYRYSHAKAGHAHITTMQRLAREGQGLSAYITRNVRDAWDEKW